MLRSSSSLIGKCCDEFAGALALCILALSAGCASAGGAGGKARAVDVASFSKPPERTAGPTTSPSASPQPQSAPAEAGQIALDENNGSRAAPDTAPAATAPSAASATAAARAAADQGASSRASLRRGERLVNPGDIVIIDSVIGQVSGRPIFADALLSPIADQLRQEAASVSPNDFPARAAQIINSRMNEVVLTELLIAEAQAALTPEQQQGLFGFLRNLREKTIATGQGSELVTEQRLQEEMGLSLEQYTEKEKNILLIQYLLNKRIQPRVIVSWKDVQREYERRKSEFNPPANTTLKFIQLSTKDQAELIEQVKTRLKGGESFDAVADSIGAPAVATLEKLPMGSGGLTDVQINDDFRPHLSGLSEGQTTEPFEANGRTVWIHVVAIDQPPQLTLFDVQRKLTEELRVRRENEERQRYISSLLARGIHDELNEMSRRVLAVALMRYGK